MMGGGRRAPGGAAMIELAADKVLSRDQAQNLVERVVKLSKADAIQVNVGGGYSTNVRFADNRISTARKCFAHQRCHQKGDAHRQRTELWAIRTLA